MYRRNISKEKENKIWQKELNVNNARDGDG